MKRESGASRQDRPITGIMLVAPARLASPEAVASPWLRGTHMPENITLRRVTYRLYPTPTQEAALRDILGLHQRLYNMALEQRRDAWRTLRRSVTYFNQAHDLTELRAAEPEYKALNAQAEQQTLKRLDKAFAAFFRRLKSGETPGFPRFKSYDRYPGWSYTNQGGWKLNTNRKGGRLKLHELSAPIRMRGRAKHDGEWRDLQIIRKAGKWYASVSMICEPKRKAGRSAIGLDWGVETFATIASDSGGYGSIENPRNLAKAKAKLTAAQQALSRKKRGSNNRHKAKAKVMAIHAKVANRRKDFLHQESHRLIGQVALIATESLSISNMTRSAKGTAEKPGKNVAQKAGLNREILDTSPSAFLAMLRYKAEEAGVVYVEIPTKKVKPSQTCSGCGSQRKKSLSEREHACECGLKLGRDENAARVMLNWALFGRPTSQELAGCGA